MVENDAYRYKCERYVKDVENKEKAVKDHQHERSIRNIVSTNGTYTKQIVPEKESDYGILSWQ